MSLNKIIADNIQEIYNSILEQIDEKNDQILIFGALKFIQEFISQLENDPYAISKCLYANEELSKFNLQVKKTNFNSEEHIIWIGKLDADVEIQGDFVKIELDDCIKVKPKKK